MAQPYLLDSDFTLYNCDVLEGLAQMEDKSVHCVVTSPPYFSLRDYGATDQIGLESTLEEHIEKLVVVFREVRRVLRRDGTCWLNYGDFFAEKQQQMAPARLALALQADGWYLRSQIVWAKPNPMPESVTDRPTSAYEFVYLLTRSPRYFYDQEAVRESTGNELSWKEWNERRKNWPTSRKNGDGILIGNSGDVKPDGGRSHPNGRNLRNVWEIPTEPYPDAHFATYPTELVRRCIAAGTSERGCCPECGAPWVREVERSGGPDPTLRPHTPKDEEAWRNGIYTGGAATSRLGRTGWQKDPPRTSATVGWKPTCEHVYGCYGEYWSPLEPTPCTVFDPFMGSGTTALVARKMGRRVVGIELNPDYCELIAKRTAQLSLLGGASGAARHVGEAS